jgi:hypothetical protein
MTLGSIKLTAAIVAVGLLSFAAGTIAQDRFPEMNNALGALQNARGFLDHARRDFGGHRVNAIRLIDQAMGEVEQGKQFAIQHGY